MYYSRCLDTQDSNNKPVKFDDNSNITLAYTDNTIYWCCNGVLALYFTIYNLTKLSAKAVYVFSYIHWCFLKTDIGNY